MLMMTLGSFRCIAVGVVCTFPGCRQGMIDSNNYHIMTDNLSILSIPPSLGYISRGLALNDVESHDIESNFYLIPLRRWWNRSSLKQSQYLQADRIQSYWNRRVEKQCKASRAVRFTATGHVSPNGLTLPATTWFAIIIVVLTVSHELDSTLS